MTQHWGNYLVRGFSTGQTSTVEIEVNPDEMRAGMVVVASRIQGLIDALGAADNDGADPLADEDTSELLRLADHLHRTIGHLTAQEDRLISLLAKTKGASTRTLATHLEVAPQTVLNRLRRINEAEAAGMNTAAYAESQDQ